MKKFGVILVAVLVVACMLSVTAMADGEAAYGISADKNKVLLGDTFTVTVSAEQNPGVYSICADLEYDDSVFEFVSKEIGTLLPGQATDGTLLDLVDFNQTTVTTETGTLATFTFKVKDDVASGTYTITVNDVESYNLTEEVDFASASVQVKIFLKGDVDDNGVVNRLDRNKLALYLLNAAANPLANEDAADIDENGSINRMDRNRLALYLVDPVNFPI